MPTGYVPGSDREALKRAKEFAATAKNDPGGQVKGSLAENYGFSLGGLNRLTSMITPMASYEDLQGYSGAS